MDEGVVTYYFERDEEDGRTQYTVYVYDTNDDKTTEEALAEIDRQFHRDHRGAEIVERKVEWY